MGQKLSHSITGLPGCMFLMKHWSHTSGHVGDLVARYHSCSFRRENKAGKSNEPVLQKQDCTSQSDPVGQESLHVAVRFNQNCLPLGESCSLCVSIIKLFGPLKAASILEAGQRVNFEKFFYNLI